MKRKSITLFFLLTLMLSASAEDKPDIWQPLRHLEGLWEGTGDGMSGISSAAQEYRFILSGKFLKVTTRSIFKPQEKNPKGEIHEDLGIISYDQSRKKFVFRGFYIEGFVNQYVLEDISEDGKTLIFETENIENAPPGTKAKLIYKLISSNEMIEEFYVAFPGQELSCFNTNKLRKKQ